MANFKDLLTTDGTCAQKTMVQLLVDSKKCYDAKEAKKQIETYPSMDILGIYPFVAQGLLSLSAQLQIPFSSLINETDLTPLEYLTPVQVYNSLDAIHKEWIRDNLTARNWVRKFFEEKLGLYLCTTSQSFAIIKQNMLFIEKYLYAGDCFVSFAQIEEEFEKAKSAVTQKELDEDKMWLIDKGYSMQDNIAKELVNLRNHLSKDNEFFEKVNNFFRETNMTPTGIVSTMITQGIKSLD